MKKSVLIVALGLGLGSIAPAFAYDDGHHNDRVAYVSRHGQLDDRINQVDRQLDRVRFELRRRGAGWQLKREVSSLSRQLDRIKFRYRSGRSDRNRLARELEDIRRDLDRIQDRLNAHRDRGPWNR
jgi:chromosome segregation ATPase